MPELDPNRKSATVGEGRLGVTMIASRDVGINRDALRASNVAVVFHGFRSTTKQ